MCLLDHDVKFSGWGYRTRWKLLAGFAPSVRWAGTRIALVVWFLLSATLPFQAPALLNEGGIMEFLYQACERPTG